MKRRLIPLLTIAIFATSAAAAMAAVKKGTTIRLEKTSLGKILTNNRGATLYEFARDKRNKDVCVKILSCSAVWPLVTTKAKPVAGPGVKRSLLGTIKLANGTRQVTYGGHPLYTYAGDTGPRQTDYVGIRMFGGAWDALNASAHAVK